MTEMNQRLALFMRSEELTAAKLAEIVQVQPSSISHLLSGRNKPNFDFVSRMLRMFPELNPDWLINGIGTMYRYKKHERSTMESGVANGENGEYYNRSSEFKDIINQEVTSGFQANTDVNTPDLAATQNSALGGLFGGLSDEAAAVCGPAPGAAVFEPVAPASVSGAVPEPEFVPAAAAVVADFVAPVADLAAETAPTTATAGFGACQGTVQSPVLEKPAVIQANAAVPNVAQVASEALVGVRQVIVFYTDQTCTVYQHRDV